MLSLPECRLRNGHWVYASELLMAAATQQGVSLQARVAATLGFAGASGGIV
jgi:hypothetical protein